MSALAWVALAGWLLTYGVSWRWLVLRGQLRRAELHCDEIQRQLDKERRRLLMTSTDRPK